MSEFEIVLAHRGLHRLVSPEAAAASRRRQRRYGRPKPPRIQALLRQAQGLQDRLDRDPGLTRDALAKELGMTPSRLSMILNLLNLDPRIQQHILGLPPASGPSPLTERRLRPLARNRDHAEQLVGFEDLLRGKSRPDLSPLLSI